MRQIENVICQMRLDRKMLPKIAFMFEKKMFSNVQKLSALTNFRHGPEQSRTSAALQPEMKCNGD